MYSQLSWIAPVIWQDARIALDAVCLAEVRFVYTVNFGNLDSLLLEGGRSLFVVRSQRFAMAAPVDGFQAKPTDLNTAILYHGAKNSTKINGSGFTEDSKEDRVRLSTSDSPSAATSEAKASSDAA
jgi:hypothetical protein